MAVPEWLRSHKIQHPGQVKFLMAYSATGMIKSAVQAAQIDRSTHYEWLKDPEYKSAFEDAKTHVCDILEDAAFDRAVNGVSQPVFHQGLECGTTQEFSDGLMLRLLAGNMPNKYREKVSAELTGKNGEPIKVIVETGVLLPDPKPNADAAH